MCVTFNASLGLVSNKIQHALTIFKCISNLLPFMSTNSSAYYIHGVELPAMVDGCNERFSTVNLSLGCGLLAVHISIYPLLQEILQA